jgi:hypothetical protein
LPEVERVGDDGGVLVTLAAWGPLVFGSSGAPARDRLSNTTGDSAGRGSRVRRRRRGTPLVSSRWRRCCWWARAC